MSSFKITAPGKVILFGEHAVVYGKTALAASLDLRSSLTLRELSASHDDHVRVDMPRLSLSLELPASRLRQGLFHADFPRLSLHGHDTFLRRIREFLDDAALDLRPRPDPRQRTSLECLLYALLQVAQDHSITQLPPFHAIVDTQLSIGAGAGSSASFAVCLSAAFLRWAQLLRHRLGEAAHPGGSFDSASLAKISNYALNCERIMHGAPSGIDNAICTYGSVMEFRKAEEPRFVEMSRGLRILLVDTRVGRSTKVLVDRLAGLLGKYRGLFERVVEAMDQVAREVVGVIERLQRLKEAETERIGEVYKELALLVDVNQGLLATCQVSHPSLDLICLTAKRHGFAAKLTGAGGGGFAYVLIPPGTADAEVANLSVQLTENGFAVMETQLGGSGVEVQDVVV